jgi:hypothetical protein
MPSRSPGLIFFLTLAIPGFLQIFNACKITINVKYLKESMIFFYFAGGGGQGVKYKVQSA